MIRLPLLAAASAALLLLLPAPAARAGEPETLPNGLRIVLEPQRGAPAVAVAAFVDVGRVDEPPRIAGITHFVEHLLFRATARRPAGEVKRDAWASGISYRAYTSEEYLRLLAVLPSDRLSPALDVLSDSLTGARFRADQVEEERRVVLEEIAKRVAEPDTRLGEASTALAFLPHPLGERIIGTAASVSRITRDDLVRWHRERFRPERTVLVLVGDFDPAAAREAVAAAFRDWRGDGPLPPAGRQPPPSAPGRYQELFLPIEGASPAVMVSAAAPGMLSPDYMPARFLSEVLAGRVRRRIAGPDGPAIAVDAWLSTWRHRCLLRVRAILRRPEDAAAARDGILAEFEALAEGAEPLGGIPETAEHLRSRETIVREDLGLFAEVIGRAVLAGYYHPDGRPEHLVADDRYTRVGEADVAAIARRLLRRENLRVVHRLPPGSPPPAPPPPAPAAEDPAPVPPPAGLTRVREFEEDDGLGAAGRPRDESEAVETRLPSGLRLVLLEDSSLPLVGLSLVFPAGSRLDPPGQEGLARLAASAIPRSTIGYEDVDLRWRLFAIGNEYSFTADRDATRIRLTTPRRHLEEALRVLGAMVAAPAYSDDAVEEARGRLAFEASSAEERIGTFTGAAFRAALFPGDGYGREPHGRTESLAGITREDLVAWHARHLALDGAVLAIVGDFAPRRTRDLVQAAFSGGPRGGADDPAIGRPPGDPPPPPAAPPPSADRAIDLAHPSGRGFVMVGAAGPALPHEDYAALTLLQQVLGWRVFEEFTMRRAIAYEAGAAFEGYAAASTLGLYVGCAPGDLPEVRAWLVAELASLRAEGPAPALVEDARRAWLGGHAVGSAPVEAVASRIAWQRAVGTPPDRWAAVLARIAELTPADLMAAARRWLAPERLVVVTAGAPRPDGGDSK